MSKRMRWPVLGLPVRLAMLAVMAVIWLSFPAGALAGSDTWTTGGPYGGGASSLVISPAYAADHTLFASSDGDGIFKSTSGGASWSPIDTGLTNLAISRLAVSPAYATDHTLFASDDAVMSSRPPPGGQAGLRWTPCPRTTRSARWPSHPPTLPTKPFTRAPTVVVSSCPPPAGRAGAR